MEICRLTRLSLSASLAFAGKRLRRSTGRRLLSLALTSACNFHPTSPGGVSPSWIAPTISSQLSSKHPPAATQKPGSCCFGIGPSGCLSPALHQASRLREGAGPARHQNHLVPIWLPTARLATPCAGGTSPAHTDTGGTAGCGDTPPTLAPGIRVPHHPEAARYRPTWGGFRSWLPPLHPGSSSPRLRARGKLPRLPPRPPPHLQPTTQKALSREFFCQAMSDPTDGKDGRSEPKTTRAGLMPRRVRMDVRGKRCCAGREGDATGDGAHGDVSSVRLAASSAYLLVQIL